MIGHEKQEEMFARAIKNGKLSHAYALTGPEHIGKMTFALELTKILGCHPVFDVALYDSEEGMGIDKARELQHNLNLTSAEGRYKVAIIAYAERMSEEAGSAILKFLEGPPARTVIFLITSNYYALLPTIASRVVRVSFGRITESEMKTHFSDEISSLAGGRPGLAKKLSENEEALAFLKEAGENYNILSSGKVHERLQTAEKFAQMDTPQLQSLLAFWMERWAENPLDHALGTRLLTAFRDLRYNLNSKLAMDNLFLQ